MLLSVGAAHQLVCDLLVATGMSRDRAMSSARGIVLADVWGVSSHGMMRMPSYLTRLREGGYVATAELRTVRDTGAAVVLDGGGGLGHWQVRAASEEAAARAARWGVGVTAVANSGHCGALGVHTLPGLERDLITVVFSHGPPAMPPWGGTRPVLSSSPLAAGIPGRPRPVIVDLATTSISRGAIAELAGRGEPLPPGCAFDEDGEPTIDPAAALKGMLAPIGGAKGFALAYLVEALTAGLIGPRLSARVPDPFAMDMAGEQQQIAHLVLALDPGVLDPSGGTGAAHRLAALAELVAGAGGRSPGANRRLPHEIEESEHVAVMPNVWRELARWAGELAVQLPDERGNDTAKLSPRS